MALPKITTSEEAVAFGKIATKDDIEELKLTRKYYVAVCKKRPDDASVECLEKYMQIAFKGQLMREALEAAGHYVHNPINHKESIMFKKIKEMFSRFTRACKEMFSRFTRAYIVAPFPYAEACWHCNTICEGCSVDPHDVNH